MEICFQDWLDIAYGGKVPADDPGRPMREAQRLANTEEGEELDEARRTIAMTLIYAVEKCQEAVDAIKAEVALNHPEHLEELNRQLAERHEGDSS